MPQPAATLTGPALHALFERAWALLDVDEEDDQTGISDAERRDAVAELLRQQPLAPANMGELYHLHRIWMALDEPAAANAALHQHRAAVLSASTDPGDALGWELLDLTSRWHFDQSGGTERLAALMAQLHASPEPDPHLEDAWENAAGLYQAWHLIDAHLDWQRQQPARDGMPERWRDAFYWRHKAEHALRRGDMDAVGQHILAAITHHGKAAREESGGFEIANMWEHLATVVTTLAPQQMPALVEAARAHLDTQTPPVPIRTHWETHFARWQAHAMAVQERWDEALVHARRGHYVLENEPYNADEFGTHMLDWLVKAGRMDEAAELAWRGLWCTPFMGMGEAAYALALQMRDEDASRPQWDWTLAAAQWRKGLLNPWSTRPGLLEHLEQRPPLPPEAYLERARQIAPDSPVPALIEGVHLAEQEHWQAALPLLEHSVLALPAYADVPSVDLLWRSRIKSLPAEEALNRPVPECGGAVWCYGVGHDWIAEESDGVSHISDTCTDEFTDANWPRRRALGLHYWETARARFEACFANGEGAWADADIAIYAFVCHALGYQYKVQGRMDEAIPVLQAGIATGRPTWKHYSNLMECFTAQQDYPAVLALAEPFWHDLPRSIDQTDSVFAYCIPSIAWALHMQQRHHELSIWIDRLNQWWEQREDDEEDEVDTPASRSEYLYPLMHLLQLYSLECPERAAPLVRAHLAEALALDDDGSQYAGRAVILRDAGNTLTNCGDDREAINLYRHALAAAPPDAEQMIGEIHEALANCQQRLGESAGPSPKRKFWQFWK